MDIFSKLKSLGNSIKKELIIYKLVLKDKRTPLLAKLLIWLAVGYLLMPFDLIPDFIPLIGQIDDIIIVPALIYFSLKLIPEGVIEEYRVLIR